ncbi:MAG: metallophosphoesterase family protein, partial [Planctomycetota bacterium]
WWRSRVALLCADCQFNNNYCKPLPERNLSAEAIAGTAIRPPQLDLFAPDVLEWILQEGSPGKDVILHLGDATNVATTGEFARFVATMEKARTPWFMSPGNHDMYYFGVYDSKNPKLLKDAKYESGEPMDKAKFIRYYLSAILRQSEPGCVALAQALGIEQQPDLPLEQMASKIPDTFEWRAELDDNRPMLRRIHWTIDKEEPQRSYIIQSVDLSGAGSGLGAVRVFLLDSCQYQRRPEMVPNAWGTFPLPLNCGLTGEMLPDQLRKIRQWLAEGRDHQSTVFMCHHPFDHIAPKGRSNLGWLWRENKAALLVTAHTHAGFFAHHDLDGKGGLELNIGSTTDWPMEWRMLQGFVNPEKKRVYIRTPRSTLVDVLQKRDGFFEPGWEVPIDEPDDYRSYKQGQSATGLLVNYYLGFHYTPYWADQPNIRPNKATRRTEMRIKDTLLWTYLRLVTNFPTAPEPVPEWPAGCASDAAVVARIKAKAADQLKRTNLIRDPKARRAAEDALFDSKIALLVELAAFEASRSTVKLGSGESTDAERMRYKITQAAYASRFMNEKGRRLRIEDETINVGWDDSVAAAIAEDKAARK